MADRTPTIGVLALQGDVREHRRMLSELGCRTVPVRRESELAGLDGIVLPGGESTTMSKLLLAFDLLDPVRERIRGGLPAYGSCAGMILLADRIVDGTSDQQTIGGLDVTVRRNAFGRQVDSFEADVALQDVAGEPFHAVFIRAPWVEAVGAGASIVGRVEAAQPGTMEVGTERAERVVAVRQRHLLATSFHPELTGDARVHALFLTIVKESNR